MPTTPDGISSKPPGTDVVTDTTISSLTFNSLITDIYQALNKVKQVTQGGTGAQTVLDAAKNLGVVTLADFAGTATVGGPPNIITFTTLRVYTAYSNEMRIVARMGSDSTTGGTNGNVDSLGAKAIKTIGPAGTEIDIGTGDWYQGSIREFRYVSTANSGNGALILIQSGGGAAKALYEYRIPYSTSTTMTASSWTTWPLDTEVYDPSALGSVAANTLTVARAGLLRWSAYASPSATTATDNTFVKTRLFNVTNSAVVKTGSIIGVATGSEGSKRIGGLSTGAGQVEAGKQYRIQYYVFTTGGSANFNGWSTIGAPDLGDVLSLQVTLEA